jgi:hypothetical protein
LLPAENPSRTIVVVAGRLVETLGGLVAGAGMLVQSLVDWIRTGAANL